MSDILYEHELYLPVKTLFEQLGYEVKAEVKNCDAVAVKDGETVIIELKLRLNLDVLLQAVDRQKMSDTVYIAVPFAKKSIVMKRYAETAGLLRRLGIGLIIVRRRREGMSCEIAQDAGVSGGARNKRRTRLLMNEFDGRTGDNNVGGTTKTPLITAYRENTLVAASILSRLGEASAALLRKSGAHAKVYQMLVKNYYGWFERTGEKGVFRLTASGAKAVENNAELIEKIIEK